MQAWAGFAQAGAVIVAAAFAANTFKGWRLEKIEGRKIDAAEKILTLGYQVRQAFSVIRNPMKSQSEAERAVSSLMEDGLDLSSYSSAKLIRVTDAQIVIDRVNRFSDLWNQFSTIIPIGTALFGKEVDEVFQQLWRQKSLILGSAMSYPNDDGADQELSLEIRKALWEDRQGATEGDRVLSSINTALSVLDDILLPVIRIEYQQPK